MTGALLVLVGPMGAGKTSLGRRVARRLGVPFVDTDRAVVAEHGPIPDLFAAHGEAHFRRLERAAVARALTEEAVVALGGGAVLDPDTRVELQRHRVVLLTLAPSAVTRRIRPGTRPLLAGDEDPVQRWERIWQERRPLYEEVADVAIDTSTRPITLLAEEIVAWAGGPVVAA